jgi:quinone-modifying oxidoreductase subunit QmoC
MLLGIPAALLTAALILKEPIQKALGIGNPVGDRIIYSYSNVFPRWLINGFFLAFTALAILMLLHGVLNLWRAVRATGSQGAAATPAKGLLASVLSAFKSVIVHDRFAECTKAHTRYWSHLSVFFGFLALSLVSLWVITAPYNPLLRENFIYPFSFLNPWKMLANAGGIAVIAGCLWMIWDRMKDTEEKRATSFFDWAFIVTLFVVVVTGFITEVLHYVRLEPHRHLAYFTHLVCAAALLLYLPYSKFAHMVYRTTALVCAEYYGRTPGGAHVAVPRKDA